MLAALRRQRQGNLCNFKAILVYTAPVQLGLQRNPTSKRTPFPKKRVHQTGREMEWGKAQRREQCKCHQSILFENCKNSIKKCKKKKKEFPQWIGKFQKHTFKYCLRFLPSHAACILTQQLNLELFRTNKDQGNNIRILVKPDSTLSTPCTSIHL